MAMEHKCPECGSVIYSRKNVLCGVCGKRLPDGLLFTATERAAVDRQMIELKRRKQAARVRDEEAASEAGSSNTSNPVAKRVGKRLPLLGAVMDFFTRGE